MTRQIRYDTIFLLYRLTVHSIFQEEISEVDSNGVVSFSFDAVCAVSILIIVLGESG